ncbi:hypothetical protein HanIR_Chr07g0301711 [Helianthus annuus]|nr:hypothetical protein HanIR_Chr07g0301711 [Helianthus annuus]
MISDWISNGMWVYRDMKSKRFWELSQVGTERDVCFISNQFGSEQ